MLTFKKGSFTQEELTAMLYALQAAQNSIECVEPDCENCGIRRPCEDIGRTIGYITKLIKKT